MKTKNNNQCTDKPFFFRVEVDKVPSGLAVLVHGVSSIKDFSKSEAVFRTSGSLVRVFGDALSITVYEGRAVEVVGKVAGVEFL